MKKKLLTKEQINTYNGVTCPRCNSNDIEASPILSDSTMGLSSVKCNNCKLTWEELWKMTGIVSETIKEKT